MEDNKLDKFFRKKITGVEPEFDPKFWEQAERMLDAQPEEKRRRRAAWWWLLPLLFISGCGLWWSGFFANNKVTNSVKTEVILEEKTDNNSQENHTDTNYLEQESSTYLADADTDTTVDKDAIQSVSGELNSKNGEVKKDKEFQTRKENVIADKKRENRFNLEKHTLNSPQEFSESLDLTPPTNTSKNTETAPEQEAVIYSEITPKTEAKKRTHLRFLASLTPTLLQSPLVEIDDSLKVDTECLDNILKPKKIRYGWSIGAVVRRELSPDTTLNTLAALRAGLTLDYQLSKKWDVHFDLLGQYTPQTVDAYLEQDTLNSGLKYGFGVTGISHSYRLKTQYFLEGLALLRFKINERHGIGLGVGLRYLLSVRGDLIEKNSTIQFINEPAFVTTEQVVASGWWQKENTQDILPFLQLRYDYRMNQNSSLFLKLNTEYNSGWYTDPRVLSKNNLKLETSFGFNYQF